MTDTLGAYVRVYHSLGWYLVPIPRGRKGPAIKHWNRKEYCIGPNDRWPEAAGGVGLAHAYSGTCCIDIDNYLRAQRWLERRYNLQLADYFAAANAVQIRSGRPGRGKLLYRLPPLLGPLVSKQVYLSGEATIDFRCATKDGLTVQDVLPPSVHPDTRKPYQWVGDYTQLPEIPLPLLRVWMHLLEPPRREPAPPPTVSREEVASALAALDPDMPREDWVRVGMAIHSVCPDWMDLWDEWSSKGSKYKGTDIEPVWRSFDYDPQGVTVRTLFQMARDAGWKGYRPPAEKLFQAVAGEPPATETLPPPPPKRTMRDLLARVEQTPYHDEVAAKAVMADAVSLGMDPLQEDQLVALLKQRSSFTLAALRKMMKAVKAEAAKLLTDSNLRLKRLLEDYIYLTVPDRILHIQSGEMMKPEAFVRHYIDAFPTIREAMAQPGLLRRAHNRTFRPDQPRLFTERGAVYWNDWTGLRPDCALEGDVSPWLQHLTHLIPDPDQQSHLLDWLAFTLQHPERKINHCLVILGKMGVGKDTLLEPVLWAFDRHAHHVGADAFAREFNSFLANTKLVVLQEADLGNRQQARLITNRMKPILASPPPTLYINPKGQGEYHIPNIVHLVLYSNEQLPVLLTEDDRRHFVIQCEPEITDENRAHYKEYFRALWDWLKNGGRQAVVAWLLARDLSGFDPKAAPPMTEAKAEIIEYSRPSMEQMLRDAILAQEGPFARDVVSATEVTLWLQTEGAKYMSLHGETRPPSRVWVGRTLAHIGCPQRQIRVDRLRERVYIVRNAKHWKEASGEALHAELHRDCAGDRPPSPE